MAAFFFMACKKDKAPTPPLTKTEMLCGKTSKKWKVVGYQRSINSPVTAATTDILNTMATTYRDNLLVFYPDGVEKLNEGPTGTNPGMDYSTVSWLFQNNETVIGCTVLFGILGNGDAQLNCSITELTEQKMVLDNLFPFGATTYYNRWTLVPAN